MKKRLQVRRLFRALYHAYRYAGTLLPQPVLLLDSTLNQMDWFGFRALDIQRKALRDGMVALHHSVSLPAPAPFVTSPINLGALHRGIKLFPAVEYSLYVSLGIARHEFNAGDPAHAREAARWLAHASAVTDELIALLERIKPWAVVYPQGYFVEGAIARQLAVRIGFQLFALENTFHPEKMICEPATGISVNRNSVKTWPRHPPDSVVGRDTPEQLMLRIDAGKRSEHASPERAFSWPAGRKRVLFLAQCLTDSSVLFGTTGPYSTIEIVQALLSEAQSNGDFVMVKLHPKENGGLNPLQQPYAQLTLRRLQAAGIPAVGAAHYAVDASNVFSTQALMREANVVVTINSQGGLEAQAFGKEVVLLGEAFYDAIGTTWNLTGPGALPETLDAILRRGARRANAERTAQFLKMYFDDYCIQKDPASLVRAIRERRGQTTIS